ncbi:hypothetical protein PSN01_03941 [Micromonospora saelicesensis]|nr:hypothetical protein PSN01_03941 [Micromonospora saelicesensis]
MWQRGAGDRLRAARRRPCAARWWRCRVVAARRAGPARCPGSADRHCRSGAPTRSGPHLGVLGPPGQRPGSAAQRELAAGRGGDGGATPRPGPHPAAVRHAPLRPGLRPGCRRRASPPRHPDRRARRDGARRRRPGAGGYRRRARRTGPLGARLPPPPAGASGANDLVAALPGVVAGGRPAGVRPDACGADGLPYPAAAPGRLLRVRAAGQRPLRPGRVHRVFAGPAHRCRVRRGAGRLPGSARAGCDRVAGTRGGERGDPDDRRAVPGPAHSSRGPARHGRWRDPSLHRLHLLRHVPPGGSGGPRPRRGPRAGARAGVPAPAPLDGRGGAARAGPGRGGRSRVLRQALRPQPGRAGVALPRRRHHSGRGGRDHEFDPAVADDLRDRR